MHASDHATAPLPDDGTKSRSVWHAPFIIISLAFILARAIHPIFGPAKKDIASDLGVSLSEVVATQTAGYFVSACIVIPAAILVSRLSAGALGWICVLLLGLGNIVAGLSPDLALFYVGTIIAAIGSILMVPIFGQIGRDLLTVRTFVVATTVVVVLGRAMQAGSFALTNLFYESIGWRILYIGWGVTLIPIVILAWRCIKRTKPTEGTDSLRKILLILGWLLKRPLVWMCGLAFGLTVATVGNFGFIWDINLQEALGWDAVDTNLLTLMFIGGVIVGGYFATWFSKWIGEYPAILISMGAGVILFSISVFLTSSLRDFWVSAPMLFCMGFSFGAGAMIQPHVSRFFDTHMSAMFFGVTTAIYLALGGVIIAVPVWSLPKDPTWSVMEVREALIPYAIMIAAGIAIFAATKWIPKQDTGADEVK